MKNTFIQKPELPKEVCQAIEYFTSGLGDRDALKDMATLERYATSNFSSNENSRNLYNFIKESEDNQRKFFTALATGYTEEKTKEEKALESAQKMFKEAYGKWMRADGGSRLEAIEQAKYQVIRDLVSLELLPEEVIQY
jgi:ATP-dependent DNA ligase